MNLIMIIFSLFFSANCAKNDWNCSIAEKKAAELFKNKVLLNPYPLFENDPYLNQTSESYKELNKTLLNKDLVCAIKYKTDDIIEYWIKNFENSSIAMENDYIITHQGRCGVCSSLNDLAIYLTVNLTSPSRKCGMIAAISETMGKNCFLNIGFSEQCAQIWLFNTKNTRKNCFNACMLAWILNEPFNKPDGSLNSCLQCDEDNSGPVFKYFSGRTRRNSGIRSEIDRPSDQVYNITHCYY